MRAASWRAVQRVTYLADQLGVDLEPATLDLAAAIDPGHVWRRSPA